MADQVTVVNTKPNRRRFHMLGSIIKIEPGANLVDLDVYTAMRKVKHIENLFARNFLKVEAAPTEKGSFKKGMHVERITDLKVPDALAAVSSVSDPNTLKKWADQDGRKKVKEALIERHQKLIDDSDPDPNPDEDFDGKWR